MDRKLIPKITSSPAETDSSGTSIKNDSFLEDMGILSHDAKISTSNKEAERHVTQRNLSPAVLPFSTVIEEQDALLEQQTSLKTIYSQSSTLQRRSGRREVFNTDRQRSGDGDARTTELKVKIQDSKPRSLDTKSKSRQSESKTADNQTKTQNESNKYSQDRKPVVKDRGRRSGSYKDSDQSGEARKENKLPLNMTKQANSSVENSKDHPRRSEGGRIIESKEISDPVALLSAVKELISTYTKEEGLKIHRTLNELHILSQTSLLKNIMFATDEIRKDLQLGANLGQLKALMAENERLRENLSLLIMKNEDLQRRVEEIESVKEENVGLKLRLQEIAGLKSG